MTLTKAQLERHISQILPGALRITVAPWQGGYKAVADMGGAVIWRNGTILVGLSDATAPAADPTTALRGGYTRIVGIQASKN